MLGDITGTYMVDSQDALRSLAHRVADGLESGDVLLLSGDLGAGKTAFVKELAQALMVGEMVTSPTFTVAAEYDVPHSHVIDQLIHIDLYRLGDNAEGVMGEEDGHVIKEMLMMAQQLKRVVVIEWAQKLRDEVKDNHWQERAWKIDFAYGRKDTEREVDIKKALT